MARMIAYSATDMASFAFFDGQIEEFGEDRIVFSDGTQTTRYGGEFRYSPSGDLYGTLRTIEQSLGQTSLWKAWDIGRNAHVFNQFVAAADIDGAMAFLLSGPDEITGSSGWDTLLGFAGSDTLSGGDGWDELDGGWGADLLIGGAGRDLLGGFGDDTMEGGEGGDFYVVDTARDVIIETGGGYDRVYSLVSTRLPRQVEVLFLVGDVPLDGVGNPLDNTIVGGLGSDRLFGLGGDDRLVGNEGNDVLLGGVGDDSLFGNAGDDSLLEGAGDDVLRGGTGRDILRGGVGDDALSGDWGDDVLVGGAGVDRMSGGEGNDLFRFRSSAEIGRGSAADTIEDFTTGDRIDLRGIDADETEAGRQAFDFIGGAWFSGEAGELRFRAGRLMADTDGDGLVDFSLLLPSTDRVTASELLL